MIACHKSQRRRLSVLFTAGILFLVLGLSLTAKDAWACTLFSSNTTPIFEAKDVGKGIDGELILEITVLSVEPSSQATSALVRIERVLKGQIDRAELKVVTEGGSCAYGFGVGAHGVVVGDLFTDPNGTLVLHAKNESHGARTARRRQFSIEQ